MTDLCKSLSGGVFITVCFSSKPPQTQMEWAQLLESQQRYHDAELQKWREIIKSSVLLLDQVYNMSACTGWSELIELDCKMTAPVSSYRLRIPYWAYRKVWVYEITTQTRTKRGVDITDTYPPGHQGALCNVEPLMKTKGKKQRAQMCMYDYAY